METVTEMKTLEDYTISSVGYSRPPYPWGTDGYNIWQQAFYFALGYNKGIAEGERRLSYTHFATQYARYDQMEGYRFATLLEFLERYIEDDCWMKG